MVFYDLVEDSNKTVSASTPLDVNKGAGGQEETLADTAAFADKNTESEEAHGKSIKTFDKLISQAANDMAIEQSGGDEDKYDELLDKYTKYLKSYIGGDIKEEAPEAPEAPEVSLASAEDRKKYVWDKTQEPSNQGTSTQVESPTLHDLFVSDDEDNEEWDIDLNRERI